MSVIVIIHTEITDPETFIAKPDDLTLLIKQDWYSIEHFKELDACVQDYIETNEDIDLMMVLNIAEQKVIEQGATLLPHEQFIIQL